MPSTRSDSAPRRSSRASDLEKKKQQDEKKKAKSTTSKKASATKSKPAAPPVKKQVKQAVKKTASKVEEKAKAAPPPAQKRGPPKQREALPTKEEKKEAKDAVKETAQKGKKVVKETANKVASPTKNAVYSEGDVVEDIVLRNDSDEEVHLENLYKDQGIVIFTYPKASTPGCTTQSCKYRDITSSFESVNYKIYGLSRDSPKAQANWKTKNDFKYDLLCDPEQKLMKRLGCTDSVRRAHFIIEKGGKLLEAKVGVKPAEDADNALEFIKSLPGDKEEDKSE